MNRKLLGIIAVVFVVVLGFGAFNQAKAVPGTSSDQKYNFFPSDQVNVFGYDAAQNSIRGRDMDYRDYSVSDYMGPNPGEVPPSTHP